MSPEELGRTVELIQRLARERGLTLIFIEHDMNVIFGISEKIRVMHMGSIIAEGRPDHLSRPDREGKPGDGSQEKRERPLDP
jgi:branched-chain amino acid transport system ATP-binding protein